MLCLFCQAQGPVQVILCLYFQAQGACPGDTLAKEELFLYLTSILQQFELTSPDNQTLPTTSDGILGITLGPAPFKVCGQAIAPHRITRVYCITLGLDEEQYQKLCLNVVKL